MIFKYSDEFSIDTDQEPWKREGFRVGIYGAPGSTKSYTAAAFIVEQFLQQGGTIVIFQPRAEWHTLKDKFPDVQVIGGPYNQDVPFAASHPKLYAEAVVDQGISMIFYTPEVDDEEKLINFVDKFLDYVMKLQEVRHRPLLVLLEEAHEYAPKTATGHIAPSWVFNRMVKRCKDAWTGGRKLNIVSVALTQRPQELHFGIRQICNLSLYGQFSPQDIAYIDKECLSHYRKQGLDIKAGSLLSLEAGNFLTINHATASYEKRTVERVTPHGADTPSLELVPDSSEGVKTAVSDLGQKLKELLEAQAAEESELKKVKREKRALELKVGELDEKVKFKANLQEMLKGDGGADPKLVADNERLTAELVRVKKDYYNASEDAKNLNSMNDELVVSINKISADLANLKRYEKFGKAVDALCEALGIRGVQFRITELMSDVKDLKARKVGTDQGATLIVDKKEVDLEVRVHRETVSPSESTLKGQIATLIAEGIFDKPLKTSTVATKLKDFYPGGTIKKDDLMQTLYWLTEQRILEHDAGSGGSHHSFKVRDKSRVELKEV